MFTAIKYRYRVLSKLYSYSAGVKRYYCINFFLKIVIILLSLIQPIFYKFFIDKIIILKEISLFPYVLLGYFSVLITNFAVGYVVLYFNNKIVNRITFRVKYKLFISLFKKDFHFYEKMSIGNEKMILEDDINSIREFSDYQTLEYIKNIIMIIVAIIILFISKWQLAFMAVVFIPVSFLANHYISKDEGKIVKRMRDNDHKLYSWLHESAQGWREIKALNLQKREEINMTKYLHKWALLNAKWINFWTLRVLILPRIKQEFLMQFMIYFVGGLLIMKGNYVIGSLLAFVQYYNLLADAVEQAAKQNADMLTNKNFSDNLINAIIDINHCDKINKKYEINEIKDIVLHNVYFNYPGSDNEVISNFSLTIKKGERVAIVGKSGSGKTTLLKLIIGIVTPSKGRIEVSGQNIKDIDLLSLHRRIGYVMQENILFNISIRDNLMLGNSSVSDEKLDEICKKANIYNYIQSLDDKYDTIVGEKGIKLSGGQRQRIVLARVLLRDVDVLILDEATSALDQYNENLIKDIIDKMGDNKTIIVVAHRKSSIDLCDKIVRIDQGKLEQQIMVEVG